MDGARPARGAALGPGTVVDRYEVIDVIGAGGVATVYRVRHRQLGSEHALKVIDATGKALRDRLLQEGRVQAALRHPNIVAVTDVVEVDGAPGLILELVRGPSLARMLAARPLTLEQADVLAGGILAAVREAHRHGTVHRDLKPANVLLEVGHATLTPKVADFGLAKVLTAPGAPGTTRSGAALGTPRYMAPEQIRDARNVDQRADVFSLGAVLYEMVCGRPAFDGPDTLAVYRAIAQGRFVPPHDAVPGLPDRMARAIEAALVVDVEARAPSAEAIAALWEGGGRPAGAWSEGDLDDLAGRPAAMGALAAVVERTLGHTWQDAPSDDPFTDPAVRPKHVDPAARPVPVPPPRSPVPSGAAPVLPRKAPHPPAPPEEADPVAVSDASPSADEEPTVQLDDPFAELPDLTIRPHVDGPGESTIVRRIHRRYGIVAAIAAVVVTSLAVVAGGLVILAVGLALWSGAAPETQGPSVEAAVSGDPAL